MVTVFGILNLTEDSFFDESRRLDPAGAVTAANPAWSWRRSIDVPVKVIAGCTARGIAPVPLRASAANVLTG